MQAFHLPDLKDIVVNEPEEVEEADTLARDGPAKTIEVAESEANPVPPQESQDAVTFEKLG